MIIYKVELAGIVKYVGITSKLLKYRITDHIYSANRNSPYLIHRAIRKYGNLLKFSILEIVNTKEEACFLEKYYINHFNTYVKNGGYNLTFGGEGAIGLKFTNESRKKLSLSKIGKKSNRIDYSHTPEAIEKIRRGNLGKTNPNRCSPIIDENGIIYRSITSAAKATGLKRTTINQALSENRKLFNGKCFKYVKKENI